MAGDVSCEWAPWFRTNFENWEYAPSDFDMASWTIDHTRMLRELRQKVVTPDVTALQENQGQFWYPRPETDLVISGKPDLVVIDGDIATVFDAKTGQPRTSDQIQVTIYMYCLARAHADLSGKTIQGQLVYRNRTVDIPVGSADESFEKNLNYFLDILDSDEIPIRVPSARECSWCNISGSECPERIESEG